MWSVQLLLLCLFCACRFAAADDYDYDDDDDLSVSRLVLGQGYPFQEYEVVTDDGYILSLHRIPYGRHTSGKVGTPVIIQHGIMANSACWVLSDPDHSLGFIMADAGYDVWMPNNRGTNYSPGHVRLDPSNRDDQQEYWDFSFHEMGYYDQPAIIDFILNKTGHEKLFYIGHSQGTTQFFALMSSRPEYNQKVIHMSALAPIAFLDNTRGTLRALNVFSGILTKIASIFHIYNVLPKSPFLKTAEKLLCRTFPLSQYLCENLLFLIAGYDTQEVDIDLIPAITKYTPSGASSKQLLHFGQLAKNGQLFRQYDYGWNGNLEVYGQGYPPEYDLSRITTPITLHYSQNDWISGIKDVEKLWSELPNAEGMLVPFYYFNHLDFMWAKHAWELLYGPMLRIIDKYNNATAY